MGAIISPPVLGAAAFLIAEFLKISYLDVILMATIPTLLFYLGIFVMVEIDARKFNMRALPLEQHHRMLDLAMRYWFHFVSLHLDRRLHADRLFAGDVGILRDAGDVRACRSSSATPRSFPTTGSAVVCRGCKASGTRAW